MTKTIENLNIVLANSYSLYLKTQNYHWNITGPSFKALHELFQIQYEGLIPAIDDLAERIRTLGEKVNGSYEAFSEKTILSKSNPNFSSEEMVKDLVNSNNQLIDILKQGVEIAQSENDEATADILIGRIEAHEKHVWMLNSSL